MNDASGTTPDIQHLVDRTRELKRELIDYAENKRFDRYLQPIATRASETRDPRQRQAARCSARSSSARTSPGTRTARLCCTSTRAGTTRSALIRR
ncbi:MAG TPA: hypothetical protein VGG75_14590 [Trebonia sp.]